MDALESAGNLVIDDTWKAPSTHKANMTSAPPIKRRKTSGSGENKSEKLAINKKEGEKSATKKKSIIGPKRPIGRPKGSKNKAKPEEPPIMDEDTKSSDSLLLSKDTLVSSREVLVYRPFSTTEPTFQLMIEEKHDLSKAKKKDNFDSSVINL